METKINLIEILKDKPLNFKLYDAVRNIDVFLDEVLENINEIRCKLDEDGRQMIYYSHKGTLVDFEDGIVALVPSKGMRDWRKFLWKKGDVLVSNDGKTEIIFDKFDDDSYTMFSGKYGLDCSNGTKDNCGVNDWLPTDYFNKEIEDAAKTYISIIERRFGGKLNMETLEIEKTQPEFKPLDYVLCKSTACFDMKAYNLFQYAYKNKEGVHIMVGGAAFVKCIPYIGNEELLGKE
jgi:hypothetical protein